MKIKMLELSSYAIPFLNGKLRKGVLVTLLDTRGRWAQGEIAPLPQLSRETLEQAISQLEMRKDAITKLEWSLNNWGEMLSELRLYPSVSFGLESAILSLIDPLEGLKVVNSALLMGSKEEILKQAALRYAEGYRSAKLKVSQLAFGEAADLIRSLKDKFYLRIDVNGAWETEKSLRFFSQFETTDFEYVEEPFQNRSDLANFSHPLAVDESFPSILTLNELAKLPQLKALIYKPTIQGGGVVALPLYEWLKQRNIALVLSSAFESALGLKQIASLSRRLSIKSPLGLGTFPYMRGDFSEFCKILNH